MGLVMTAKRIGLSGATAATSPLPQRAELTKQYLFKVWAYLEIMCRRFVKIPTARQVFVLNELLKGFRDTLGGTTM